jgi:DNA-directed RNA polymerase specialized sigma24 family protein
MPGPKPENPIELKTEEEHALRRLASSWTVSYGQVLRARMVLAAYDHPDWSNHRIGQALGCSYRTVRKWRQRWSETRGMEDLPRPGAPRHFSP